MTDAPCHATDALSHAPSELLARLTVQGGDMVMANGGEALEAAQRAWSGSHRKPGMRRPGPFCAC